MVIKMPYFKEKNKTLPITSPANFRILDFNFGESTCHYPIVCFFLSMDHNNVILFHQQWQVILKNDH